MPPKGRSLTIWYFPNSRGCMLTSGYPRIYSRRRTRRFRLYGRLGGSRLVRMRDKVLLQDLGSLHLRWRGDRIPGVVPDHIADENGLCRTVNLDCRASRRIAISGHRVVDEARLGGVANNHADTRVAIECIRPEHAG